MKKIWPSLLVVAIALYWLMSKSTAAAAANAPGTVQVDSVALAAYKNGTATPAQMKSLGWPFIAEASLSYLSGSEGARVQGLMTNGPAVRASADLYDSALQAAEMLDPAYNNTIDGYTAKLAYMNVICGKYGRPKVYGFENQDQPHDI